MVIIVQLHALFIPSELQFPQTNITCLLYDRYLLLTSVSWSLASLPPPQKKQLFPIAANILTITDYFIDDLGLLIMASWHLLQFLLLYHTKRN